MMKKFEKWTIMYMPYKQNIMVDLLTKKANTKSPKNNKPIMQEVIDVPNI